MYVHIILNYLHDFATTLARHSQSQIDGKVMLTMILHVIIRDTTYSLLDTMSNTNFITDEVAKSLDLCPTHTGLTIETMSGTSTLVSLLVSDLIMRGWRRN